MKSSPFSAFRAYLPSALSMFILGWGGLALIITLSLPTVWPRWIFYACLFLALTGTALPVTWFLNLRFPSEPPAGAAVIVRQAIWVGVYAATLIWLQFGRVATIWFVLGLALGLIAIEYLIRMREKSRWRPAPLAAQPPAPGEESSPPSDAQPPLPPVG
jgi:hypothetical protein